MIKRSMWFRRLRDIFTGFRDQRLHAAAKHGEGMIGRDASDDPLGNFLQDVVQVGGDRAEHGMQCH